MKKFVEKLIERLEEKTFTQMVKVQIEDIVFPPAYTYESCEVVTLDDVKSITIELSEEYSANTPQKSAGDWIPVTERLPKYDAESEYYEEVIVTLNNGIVTTGYYRNLDEEWWVQGRSMKCLKNSVYSVVAWQPFPKSYIPRGQWKDAVMNHFTKIE
jgi:hypothetical protein